MCARAPGACGSHRRARVLPGPAQGRAQRRGGRAHLVKLALRGVEAAEVAPQLRAQRVGTMRRLEQRPVRKPAARTEVR